MLQPTISISKINSLPLACGNRPAILIKFFCSNNQLRLCYLTNKSYLQTLKLERDQTGFMLESTIQCNQQGKETVNKLIALAQKNRIYLYFFFKSFRKFDC